MWERSITFPFLWKGKVVWNKKKTLLSRAYFLLKLQNQIEMDQCLLEMYKFFSLVSLGGCPQKLGFKMYTCLRSEVYRDRLNQAWIYLC